MIYNKYFAQVALLAVVCAFGMRGGLCLADTQQAQDKQEMSDFSLSGFGDKGKKAWDIAGKSADIGTEVIKLNDIVGNFYGERENITLTAEKGCFYRLEGNIHLQDNVVVTTSSGARLVTDVLDWDRNRQIIQTDRPVRLSKNNLTITGLGAKGFPDLNKLDIEKNVRVNIDESASAEGKAAQKIEITCDNSLQVDYMKNIATFNDNVRAATPDGIMTSNQMELYFKREPAAGAPPGRPGVDDISAAGSRIDRILARGNVTVTRGQNVSYSEEAVYSANLKKITLSGRPKIIIYSSEGLDAPAGN